MAAPTLRFKEFDGCWVEKIISEIADVRGGKRLPKGYSLQEENNGFPYITVTDMENGTVNLEKIRYVPLEAIDQIKRYRISVDEIYISVAGTLGLVGIIPQELNNANLTENADKLTNIKCNQFYLLHYLNNGSLSKLIDSVSTIGAQPKLALYAIQGMPIFLPSLDEQTQIANFLSAVDEKINQLTQKHQLLSQYKQSMMQNLFSQQIRFKADDGSEFEEWKTVRVKDIFDVTRGQVLAVSQTISVSDKEYKFPVFSSQTKQNGLMGFYKKYLFEDAITWTTDGANAGEVNFRKGKFYCTNVCGVLKSEKGYANQCIAAILNRVSRKYVSYVGNPKLMNNVMSEIPITIPSNISEQTKIANFLSTIDQKIEVTAQQIEQAKQWKKGLLQQMFV